MSTRWICSRCGYDFIGNLNAGRECPTPSCGGILGIAAEGQPAPDVAAICETLREELIRSHESMLASLSYWEDKFTERLKERLK